MLLNSIYPEDRKRRKIMQNKKLALWFAVFTAVEAYAAVTAIQVFKPMAMAAAVFCGLVAIIVAMPSDRG